MVNLFIQQFSQSNQHLMSVHPTYKNAFTECEEHSTSKHQAVTCNVQPPATFPVMEHFYTLQGEGAHTGKAAYFIRLGGCDVGCHWCDVKESWDPTLHPLMNAEEIAETAASHCKTIVLTGGEPLMWNLDILTSKLKELGCTVHIETSGAYPMSGQIDWITLSPKKTGLPKEEIYAKASELKVIV